MSQRESGYKRIDLDAYETPTWVTEALLPYIGHCRAVWEPAAGNGKMARVLAQRFLTETSDIVGGVDFLKAPRRQVDAIITNPPYALAQQFIERAIDMMWSARGLVAMLLRTDYDHARTRQHLFGECPLFAVKLVLTRRIVWIEHPNAAPSFNHAWYIWDWTHRGPPILAYGPDVPQKTLWNAHASRSAGAAQGNRPLPAEEPSNRIKVRPAGAQ